MAKNSRQNSKEKEAKKEKIDLADLKRRIRDRNYIQLLDSKLETQSGKSLVSFGPNLQKNYQIPNIKTFREPTPKSSNKSSKSSLQESYPKSAKNGPAMAADIATLKGLSQWSKLSDLVSPRLAAYNRHRDFQKHQILQKFKDLGYNQSAINVKSQFKKISASMIERGSLGAASAKNSDNGLRQRLSDLEYTQACDPEKIFQEILKK